MSAVTAQTGHRVDADEELDLVALGRPIKGPAALTGDWRRFWHLTFNIAKTQWKMRFFGSVLGYAWQLIRPLMLFGVLYVFFTKVAHVNSQTGAQNKYYGAQLLAGIVLFTFLQESTMGSVRAVVDNEALVRKIQFPRMAIPLATVLVALFNLSMNIIVVLIFSVVQGVRPMVTWVEIPVIMLVLAALAAGLAMLLSAAFVYFRDIQPIWEVVLQVLFYSSPVMITLSTVVAHFGFGTVLHIYMSNPVALVLEQFKHAVLNKAVPGANGYGGFQWALIPLAIIAFVLGIGFWVFNRTAPYVAENI